MSRPSYLIFVTLLAAALTGCTNTSANAVSKGPTGGGGKGKGGKKGDIAAPVTVAKVLEKTVPVQIRVIGSVEPLSTVSVRAQVSGELKSVHFREGDFVKAGDLLFTIDSRTYEAQLRQIEANLARDEAQLKQAQANLAKDEAQERHARVQAERYQQLTKEGVMSREMNEQMVANAGAAKQSVAADRAIIESVKADAAANRAAYDAQKILVGYTKIYAPITGRTGVTSVKPGNVVTPSVTELTSINQLQPLYVTFSVPEQYLSAIRKRANEKLMVEATPEDGSGTLQKGTLVFVDNAVDMTTGTIKLKATFTNAERSLWPGQFVRVVLELERRNNALVVPSQAIQPSQDGTFIYVVKENQTVEVRPVVPGARVDDSVIIESGVEAGETVVTEGQLRLVPGGRVQVREPGGSGRKGGKKE